MYRGNLQNWALFSNAFKFLAHLINIHKEYCKLTNNTVIHQLCFPTCVKFYASLMIQWIQPKFKIFTIKKISFNNRASQLLACLVLYFVQTPLAKMAYNLWFENVFEGIFYESSLQNFSRLSISLGSSFLWRVPIILEPTEYTLLNIIVYHYYKWPIKICRILESPRKGRM